MGATLLFLTFLLGVGSFSILHQMSDKVRTQIELDQLTGKISLQLRASIFTLEESNKRLQIAKAVMMAGCIYPLSCLAFERAFALQKKIEHAIQELAEQNWDAQRLMWLSYRPVFSRKNSLPSLKEILNNNRTKISIRMANLISTAEVWTHSREVNSHAWKVAWTE